MRDTRQEAIYSLLCPRIPHFDRLPFSALIFVRKTFSFFFVYFMLRVSYDLYTQVSIFFLTCFTRRNKKKKFLFLSDALVEEIKNNKLYRIGIKMKKNLIIQYISFYVCVFVCTQGASEKKKERKGKTDGMKLKKKKKTPSLIYFYL